MAASTVTIPPSGLRERSTAAPPHGRDPSQGALGRLCAHVDIASLVAFRIMFGAIMLWDVWRNFTGRIIAREYIEPTFHFAYFGFEWVRPWPGGWMYLHFWMMGVLAACILVGAFYRPAAFLFFLAVSYVFLLDQATYLNHMYLVCIISFLMIFVPAERAISVDVWMQPRLRARTAPVWALWILRAQLSIVYFYAGLAKLNHDWLRGEPVRMWLKDRAGRPVIGPFLADEWATYLVSYGGLLFDLLIVPLLLIPRTRAHAFVLACAFHLTNWYLFNIGIFPWFMIAATLLYFPPDWPRTLVRRVWDVVRDRTQSTDFRRADGPEREAPSRSWIERGVVTLLALHLAAQFLFPLRHHLYPGDVAWTEEGHRFSWRMKLRSKHHDLWFFVADRATGQTWRVEPRVYLREWQEGELAGRPDMILQLAHHTADDFRRRGYPNVEVRARALTSLNGRRKQDLVDPTVDLTTRHRSVWPADWILPLYEPLRRDTAGSGS